MSDAVKALKKATQIDPSFATAHHNLALCLKQMGNTSACIAAFRTSPAPKPSYRSTTSTTGRTHRHAHHRSHLFDNRPHSHGRQSN